MDVNRTALMNEYQKKLDESKSVFDKVAEDFVRRLAVSQNLWKDK